MPPNLIQLRGNDSYDGNVLISYEGR
jgi:hypothetical protein